MIQVFNGRPMVSRETEDLGRDLWAWQRPIVTATAAAVRREFLIRGHGPSVALIMSRSQSSVASRIRAVVCWVLREVNQWSYQELGRAMNRSHKTVLSACARVDRTHELLAVARKTAAAMKSADAG